MQYMHQLQVVSPHFCHISRQYYTSTTGCVAPPAPASPRLASLGSVGFLFNRGTKSNLGFELLHILLKVELKGVPIVYPLYLDFDGFSR